MDQFLDDLGFLSVVLRGLTLGLQSLVIGGLVFRLLAASSGSALPIVGAFRRIIAWSAATLALAQCALLAMDTAILMATADLDFSRVIGADFFLAGSATVLLALAVAATQLMRDQGPRVLGLVLSGGIIAASVATSHSASRLESRPLLVSLTALHQVATGAWIGGLPYLLVVITRCGTCPAAVPMLCRRFSLLARFSVGVLLAAGTGLALIYVKSFAALVGTAYGAMVATKAVLLCMLVAMGALNHSLVKRLQAGDAGLLRRLRGYVEVEIGIGVTVILAAASLTSQPPAIDTASSQVPMSEIVRRFTPAWPRLSGPAPSEVYKIVLPGQRGEDSGEPGRSTSGDRQSPATPGMVALSEFNHHWAGVFVLAAGLLATAARAGVRWTRHWPWTFMGLGIFLFFLADADYWPLGQLSFWKGFAVAEVLQHRLVLPLVTAFAWFEWRVQTGRSESRQAALVFPAVCLAGSSVLLTHTHSLSNAGEELLAELSHIPIALAGIMAGWSRWLELRLPDGPKRAMSWIWPVCFVLIGALLLNYRES